MDAYLRDYPSIYTLSENINFICEYCDVVFNSQEELDNHNNTTYEILLNKKYSGYCFCCDEYIFLSIDRSCQINLIKDNVYYVYYIDSYVCKDCYFDYKFDLCSDGINNSIGSDIRGSRSDDIRGSRSGDIRSDDIGGSVGSTSTSSNISDSSYICSNDSSTYITNIIDGNKNKYSKPHDDMLTQQQNRELKDFIIEHIKNALFNEKKYELTFN